MSGSNHERSDARPGAVVGSLAVLTLGTLASLWVAGLLDDGLDQTTGADAVHPLADPDAIPPEPRLQVRPADELADHRRVEDQRLGTYRWIDRPAGRVGVPAERAVELILERGFPVREDAR